MCCPGTAPALWHCGRVSPHQFCGHCVAEETLLSCHSSPQTWDGFWTCPLNWFILVEPKSCGALKRWKSPALNENRCQVVSRFLSYAWAFPLKSLPLMCVRKPQPPPSGDRWRWVEMVTRQHLRLRVITPHPLATTQPPSSSPSQLQARSPTSDHLHTRALGTHDLNRFSEFLLFCWQPLAELFSCWHLGIMSMTVPILAHFSIGSFWN